MDRRSFHKLLGMGALGALAGQAGAQSATAHSNHPQPAPIDFDDHTGFQEIFDGKRLKDWDGNPEVWSVNDGTIAGVSTREKPAGNTFLVYHGTRAKDFDLKLEIKVENGGSGVQYRSSTGLPPASPARRPPQPGAPQPPPPNPQWTMIGPQADFWYPVNAQAASYSGQLYSQNTGRGILAWRGQLVQCLPGEKPRLLADIGDRSALGAFVKTADWNQYAISARGPVLVHILNGQLMAALIDDDPASSNNADGLFGLQIESVPAKVSFRNLWLKKLR